MFLFYYLYKHIYRKTFCLVLFFYLFLLKFVIVNHPSFLVVNINYIEFINLIKYIKPKFLNKKYHKKYYFE